MQTPGHKYNHTAADKLVKPNIRVAKIHKEAPKVVIEKPKMPDPTTYKPSDAFKKTQLKGHETGTFKFQKNDKIVTYAEQVARSKKHVPGVGTYKNVESAYARLSTSPPTMRTRRH